MYLLTIYAEESTTHYESTLSKVSAIELDKTLADILDAIPERDIEIRIAAKNKDIKEQLYEVAQNYDAFEALKVLTEYLDVSITQILRLIINLKNKKDILEIIDSAIKISNKHELKEMIELLDTISSKEGRNSFVEGALKIKKGVLRNQFSFAMREFKHRFTQSPDIDKLATQIILKNSRPYIKSLSN